MLIDLDNLDLYQRFDSENHLQSLQDFPDQIFTAWNQFQRFVVPTAFLSAQNIVILGVDTGNIAGEIATTLAKKHSKLPVSVHSGDHLPEWVGPKTIVLALSYSGNTKQVVEGVKEAVSRGAKLVGISTDGEIGSICRKIKAPFFEITYGARERAALPYLLMPTIGVMERLGLIKIEPGEINKIHRDLLTLGQKLSPIKSAVENNAKYLAERLQGKLPFIISSKELEPAVKRWKNSLHQNAQMLSMFDTFPEMPENTIVGLSNYPQISEALIFIGLRSHNDNEYTSLQQNVFQELSRHRWGFTYEEIVAQPQGSLLHDILTLILWGDYVSYYGAILRQLDPNSIGVKEEFDANLVRQ